MYFGNAVLVEPRYILHIVFGMKDAGLVLHNWINHDHLCRNVVCGSRHQQWRHARFTNAPVVPKTLVTNVRTVGE